MSARKHYFYGLRLGLWFCPPVALLLVQTAAFVAAVVAGVETWWNVFVWALAVFAVADMAHGPVATRCWRRCDALLDEMRKGI